MFKNLWIRFLKFLSAPGLAWQGALKKTEVKLELLSNIDMLLMIKKGIMQKLITNIWKIMFKIKNHCILNIGM